MAARDDKNDQEDYESVSAMADRLKLKGRERSRYIHDHMTSFGYRMVPSYVRDEDEEDDDGGRFRFGGSRPKTRERSSQRRTRRSDDDDDDGYPF
jgi:hypothetical protein